MTALVAGRLCGHVRKPRPGTKGHQGNGDYCGSCYQRWSRADRPPEGPPSALTWEQVRALGQQVKYRKPARRPFPAAAHRQRLAYVAQRQEDFAWLREGGDSIAVAAARVGVGKRTGERYEQLRKRGGIGAYAGDEMELELAA